MGFRSEVIQIDLKDLRGKLSSQVKQQHQFVFLFSIALNTFVSEESRVIDMAALEVEGPLNESSLRLQPCNYVNHFLCTRVHLQSFTTIPSTHVRYLWLIADNYSRHSKTPLERVNDGS